MKVENRKNLCESCQQANVSCPIYPQHTNKCVEYRPTRKKRKIEKE